MDKSDILVSVIAIVSILSLLSGLCMHEAWATAICTDENGWLQLQQENMAVLVAGQDWPVNVQLDDALFLGDATAVQVHLEKSGDEEIIVHYENDKGKLTCHNVPLMTLGENAWLRSLTYTNTSNKPQNLTRAWLYVQLNLPEEAITWKPKNFFMAKGEKEHLIVLAYKGTTDHYHFSERNGAVGHEVAACWRLQSGESAVIGSQAVWMKTVDGGATMNAREWGEAFREEAQRWYEAIDLKVPAGIPDWVREMILYEYNGGGHIDSRFSDVGGFSNLAKQTEYLAAMGISAVWLQAVHEHKSPPDPLKGGWNLYDPLDIEKVDTILGGEAALHDLCNSLKAANIHILGETVPHGGHSKQAQALPEWWTHRQDGEPSRNFGGCGMDYASPEWQRAIADSMAWQAKEFGFEGCRIDVADGSGPNWKSPRTNHASFSTLGGAQELLSTIRDAMHRNTSYPVLIPEAFDQVEYFRFTPVGYGHDFWMFIVNEVQPLAETPTEMVLSFREYLEKERGSLPAGALTLRTLNNHDTVCDAGRVHHRFGVGLSRALHGICLMIPGIPMLYQEQEIGDWFALRDMHWARRSIPEFTSESVNYHDVTFAPEVFCCLRGDVETALALGLSNLSGKDTEGIVTFTEGQKIPDGTVAYDGVTGRTAVIADNQFSWSLPPYGVSLCRIGNPPLQVEKPAYLPQDQNVSDADSKVDRPELILDGGILYIERGDMRIAFQVGEQEWRLGADDAEGQVYMTDTTDLRVSELGEGLYCEITGPSDTHENWPALAVASAQQWWVSGTTAVLRDYALRRHYPFPGAVSYKWDNTMCWVGYDIYKGVSPTGRLWESVIEPLHPDAPALCFQDARGNRLLLSQVKSDAQNIMLSEDTASAEGALRLEFRGWDNDLAPTIAATGMGQPYTIEVQEKQAKDLYTASFLLTAVTGAVADVERRLLDTSRRSFDRTRCEFVLDGEEADHNSTLGLVLPNPGTAGWSGVTVPAGVYRIRFIMRYSESGPDGSDLDNAYTIKINGTSVAYQWSERNVLHHGNAYYGEVITEPYAFTQEEHEILIDTTRKWCMIKDRFVLLPDGQ
jgi:hypothetical protein